MCHDPNKNHRVSLVALMTSCVARADERLRVFSHCLPKRGEKCCLPACTRLGQDPTDTKFRSSCRSPPRGYPRSIHPHYLSVYASTSHFEDVASITASRRLIDSLQHSIRSLWLRATPAGITPACHQTISSPHVHCFVSRIPRLHADCQEQLPTRQLFPLALALSGAISNSNSELLAAELGELHAWRALDGKS